MKDDIIMCGTRASTKQGRDSSLSSLQKGEETDMTDLQDKIAIVTGANTGMGMSTGLWYRVLLFI